MHRSGTSLATRLINMMGAYFAPEGRSLGFAPDNPKGFWERRDVLELNDRLLMLNECAWDRLSTWPDGGELAPPPTMLNQALRSVLLEMDAHRPWVLKDPRLCLTLPYWLRYMEVPVAVIAYRDPVEIARSLELRNGMPTPLGLALWEYYTVHMLNSALPLPRVFVKHSDALAEPVKFTHALHDALVKLDVRGLRLPSDREIRAFVDEKLYRARAEDAALPLTPYQQMLVDILAQRVAHKDLLKISDSAAITMKQFAK